MPAFDDLLMVITTGNLTAALTSAAATLQGTGLRGMTARVVVPTAYHDDDSFLAKVYVSDNGTDYVLLAQSAVETDLKTNPRDILIPFITNKKYAKLEVTVTSTTAANINFGVVKAGFVNSAHLAWAR